MRVLHAGDADLGDGAAGADSPAPTEEEVRIALAGNLCRCTGYEGIVKAVLAASAPATAPEPGLSEGSAIEAR